MKIVVNAGHTKKGPGSGAVYNGFNEGTITRAVTKALTAQLQAKGHKVYDATVDAATSQTAYLQEAVKKANRTNADLFISIHCNASASHQGHGTECYTYKGRQHPEALEICKNLERLGFRNRGVKDGTHLYVVRNTTAKAILVELFFLDNATDRSIYKKHGVNRMADAIANAL